jgi:signal peptidase
MEYDVAASAFKKIRLNVPSRRTAKRIASFAVVAAAVACLLLVWPGFLRGGTAYVIVSGNSMDPKLHAGDLVLTVRRSSYKVGDVVAYRIPEGQPGAGVLVIHRIVGGSASAGYIMQGDNRAGRDPWRPRPRDVVGAEGVSVPRLGLALVYLRTPLGLASLAGIVTALLILVGSGTDGSSKGAAGRRGGPARPRRRRSPKRSDTGPAWISRAASSTLASASGGWRVIRAGSASNSSLVRLTNRQRHGNAFPIALARSWGEASWTARDLRMPSGRRQTVTGGATQEAAKDFRLDAAYAEPSLKRERYGSVLKARAKVRDVRRSQKAKAVFAAISGG